MTAISLSGLLGELLTDDGVIQDVIPKVDLFRISKSSPRLAQQYDPGIIILAQGHKRIFVGDEVYHYGPDRYFVLAVPLPLECETQAPEKEPLLGFKIKVDVAMIGEILLAIDDDRPAPSAVQPAIFDAPLDQELMNASIRFLQSLQTPSDKKLLAPMIVREIIYRVLQNEKGDALRALAIKNQRFFQIAKVLNRIHETYSGKIDLTSLANESGMSISSFHASFKAVTNISPLQYVKNIRLHKARLLMRSDGIGAGRAAYAVGYESASQFNREYKRLFGVSPAKDVGIGMGQ